MSRQEGLLFVALATILLPAGARADHLTLTDGAGVSYDVDQSITFVTSSSASGAAAEAQYGAAVAASTMAGGTSMIALNDMFDGYGTIAVASDPAQQVLVTTGNAQQEIYNRTGMAPTLSCGDRELVFPTVPSTLIPGLSVARRVFVPADDDFIRWTEVLTNTGTTDLTVYLGTGNNLGSDANTVITGSSTGDTTASTDDTWVSTFQNWSGTRSSDPRIGHVLRGTGSASGVLSTVAFADGDDNPFWWYTVVVPAGQTRMVVHFATPSPTQAGSRAQAQAIASLASAATVACFTPAERRLIVNFAAVCTTGTEASPCDDGDLCTTGDTCSAGVCTGTATDCRGGLTSCVGVCNPTTGTCEATTALADGTSCDDANACTTGETCTTGVCGTGSALDCVDTDVCTTDACDTTSGCTHTMIAMCRACATPSDCDDANFCNGAEACTAGMCAPGTAPSCDDANACTTDACDATAGACTHTPISSGACAPDGGHDGGAADGGTTPHDTGVRDASSSPDAATPVAASSNCGCTTAGTGARPLGGLTTVVLVALLVSRRRRR